MLAGLVLFAPRAIAIALSVVLLLCAGRTVAAMAPLWALGYALYRYRDALRISTRLAAPVFAASVLALFFCADLDELGITSAKLLWFPFGRMEANRNMLADYLIAASFAIHLVSARALLATVAAFPAPRLIRWLGSLTFPLYCLHYPVIVLGSAVSLWPNTHWARALAITVLVFCVVVALTPATEQLKLWLRALFQKVLTRKQLRPAT